MPSDPAELGARAGELRATLALAEAMRQRHDGIAIDVDLAEFAGHVVEPELRARSTESAYYDGLMFRAYVGTDTVPVGSGGRYDGLFRSLGSDAAAAGFSLGLDRLLAPSAGIAAEGAP